MHSAALYVAGDYGLIVGLGSRQKDAPEDARQDAVGTAQP